jgi:hypothetical protein
MERIGPAVERLREANGSKAALARHSGSLRKISLISLPARVPGALSAFIEKQPLFGPNAELLVLPSRLGRLTQQRNRLPAE